MKLIKSISLLICMLAWAGCGNPADNVPKATVSAGSTNAVATTADTAAPPESNAAATTYVINSENSKVEFVGSKVTGKHDGGFKKVEGTIHVANGKLVDNGTKVVIDTTSLWSDNERLTGHLKNPDFFGVEQYPTSTFETTSISGTGADATVTGNLTLHGITKQITFPAKIEVSDQAVNVAAEFVLNRFDFEMKYPGKADDLIRKEVVLKLDVKATPKG